MNGDMMSVPELPVIRAGIKIEDVDRYLQLICVLRSGALFGMRHQGGEAWIAVKRVEVGLIFDF